MVARDIGDIAPQLRTPLDDVGPIKEVGEGLPPARREKAAKDYIDKIHQKEFLTDEEKEWWDNFWSEQLSTDWASTAGEAPPPAGSQFVLGGYVLVDFSCVASVWGGFEELTVPTAS